MKTPSPIIPLLRRTVLAVAILSQIKAQAQGIDSLLQAIGSGKDDTAKVNALNLLSEHAGWRLGDLDTALFYANEARALAERIGYRKGIGGALNNIGVVHDEQGDGTKALKNYSEALRIFEELGHQKEMADAYNNIGIVHKVGGNYPEALRNWTMALELRQRIGDRKGMAASHGNLGVVHYHQGNYPASLNQHLASLKLKEELDDKRGMSNTYGNIGLVHRAQGNLDEALRSHTTSLKLSEELNDLNGMAATYNNIGMIHMDQGHHMLALDSYNASLRIGQDMANAYMAATSYLNIGVAHFIQGDHTEALRNFKASLALRESIGDQSGMADCYNNIGSVHLKRKEYQQARTWLLRSLELSTRIGAKYTIYHNYKSLAEADSGLMDLRGAYENYKLYIAYRDSTFNEQNTKETVQLQMQYAFDKKEALTRAAHEKEQALASAELGRRSQQRNWAIVATVLISLLALSFIHRRRQERHIASMEVLRLEQEKVISELRVREQVGRDMHDDLGAGLSALRLRSEMALRNEPDPAKREHFAAMARQAEELVTNMRQLIWSMTTEDGDLPGTVDHCLRYAKSYTAENGLKATLQVEGEMPPLHLTPHERRNLFLTLKEALHNVVKHAHANEIRVRFTWNEQPGVHDGGLEVVVHDDGHGFDPSGKSDGRGLTNMRKRIEELGGTISLNSDNGTRVHIRLPLGAHHA